MTSEATVPNLQIEHLRETLGIGFASPRLSWRVETPVQNWHQTAYEIEAVLSSETPSVTTERVESSQSILVDWPFEPLQSRARVSLRVRVWGTDGAVSKWSAWTRVETGLLLTTDWRSQFISPAWDEDLTKSNPAPYLRRSFDVRPGVQSARLYITALGLYEAQINGRLVGDHVLAPGWTVYDRRLRCQTFDVSGMLQPGANAIGAILGDGWFRGRIGFGGGRRNIYGECLALLVQLEIYYADGSVDVIASDDNWRAASGPIVMNSIYDGETYDARLEQPGWAAAGFDDASWSRVRSLDWDLSTLEAPLGPPVRRTQTVKPVSISRSPSGKTLLDFGQNLVGRLVIAVQGAAGQTVTLRHAEVLEHGELGTRPLRQVEATDRYTMKGEGLEIWEPRFTFHGFRYAEVTGWPGDLSLDDIQAVVLHSDMERTGWFECSDPLLNKLHENVVWGMRGNFLDVPTDCPQRDERLGWTGDIQVFSPTASFLFDASGFLQSWLADLAAEQTKMGGNVPAVVPNILDAGFGSGAAAWADAAAVVPWVLYQRFGDAGVLADQFDSMRAWVDHVDALAGDKHLWDTGFQFGDWLDPTAPPDKPWLARTDKYIVASAYFARSAEIVGQAAGVLGLKAEEEHYLALAAAIKAAFGHEFITPAGRLIGDAETAYALALEFNLLARPEQRQRAGQQLAALVQEGGYHIRTGFVGTPLICDALCNAGHFAAAYRLLMQQGCPSWLYPVTMGATTIWERWDSMLPDGSINPGEMTSFNHYALGAVADWMQRTIAGLAPAAPGYHRIVIRPRPGAGLTHASARHRTPYGLAESSWKIVDGQITLTVTVPPNTSAIVSLPGSAAAPVEVGSGIWSWTGPFVDPDFRSGYSLDDLVGDVMSDPAANKALLSVIPQGEGIGFLLAILQNERSLSLHQVLDMIGNPPGLAQAFENALANLGK